MYYSAFKRLQTAFGRTGREKLRTGSIAYKLGQMAEEMGKSVKVQRELYESACKEMLSAAGVNERKESEDSVVLAELELPNWISKVDIVAPLRALASCYSRTGDHQCVCSSLVHAPTLISFVIGSP